MTDLLDEPWFSSGEFHTGTIEQWLERRGTSERRTG